jgi:hypothetical protein
VSPDESTPPPGVLWLHEIKHDGFRVVARKHGDRHVALSADCRGIGQAALPLCIIDGEAVACDDADMPCRAVKE